MMKQTSSLTRALGIGVLSATSVVTILRCVVFAFAFDRTTGYSDPGALSTLLYIALALALAGCVAYTLLLSAAARRKQDIPTVDPVSRPPVIKALGLLTSLACVAAAVYSIYVWTQTATLITLLYALAVLLAIPYFVPGKPIRTCAWFGLGVLAVCVFSAATEYFDPAVAMNSPIKLMQQFTALMLALYFLTELYALTGNVQPRRAALFGSLAVILSLANGISSIVAYALGDILSLEYLMRALVLLTLGLYTTARLLTARLTSPAQNQETEEA